MHSFEDYWNWLHFLLVSIPQEWPNRHFVSLLSERVAYAMEPEFWHCDSLAMQWCWNEVLATVKRAALQWRLAAAGRWWHQQHTSAGWQHPLGGWGAPFCCIRTVLHIGAAAFAVKAGIYSHSSQEERPEIWTLGARLLPSYVRQPKVLKENKQQCIIL